VLFRAFDSRAGRFLGGDSGVRIGCRTSKCAGPCAKFDRSSTA
jgi:hypothetical protein